MRKIMLYLCLLCIGAIARGQTVYEYVYWFDDDYAARQTAVSNSSAWQFEADASALDGSFHTLHVQVRDTVWSSPVTRMFINLRNVSVRDGRYWFDDEDENQHAVYGVNGLFDVDVSQLSDGLHTIHYVAMDAKGFVTPTVSRQFIKIPKADGTMTAHYWFDNDNSTMVTATTELIWLNVSALDDGLHTLHVMAESTSATQTLSYQFLKIPQTDGVDYLNCLCYLDGRLYHQEKVPSSGGIVNWQFDVSSMAQGIHNIQVQVVTPSGAATSLYESMFLRSTTHAELASMKCFYTIDNADTYIEAGTYADGAFHFDLDVSALDEGLHQLAYMLVGDNGVSTKVSSAFFMKTPLGGNGITQYWYWLNDDDANKTLVKLEERTNPFQLIGLLPVESVPIRSSLFHFEVDEKQGPMSYAKNEFHIRFYDATGRLVDATKEYLDYNVSEKVTSISRLESTQTMSRPSENEIKWYKFDAFVGDSIAFKTDKACSINVFTANGTEIYAASGSESVNFGGGVIAEDGTYYVALHDVTTTAGTNITLEFFHLAKYAVLDYSPSHIGLLGEGFVEIKLFGNGYDKLKNAYLQSSTNILQPDSVIVLGRSDMKMLYTFLENEEMGCYDIVLEFEEDGVVETLAIEKAITVEKGEWIEPEVTVSSERSTARPYPVRVKVTNNSNISMSCVPLNIAWERPGIFETVDFLDFVILSDSASNVSPISVTNNFLGKGVTAAVINMYIPLLSSGETLEFTLGFTGPSHAHFKVYAWTGKAYNYPVPTYDEYTNIPSLIDLYVNNVLKKDTVFVNAHSMKRTSPIKNYAQNAYDALKGFVRGLMAPINPNILQSTGFIASMFGMSPVYASDFPYPTPSPNDVEIWNPGDPNDIIGYSAESGSKFVKEGLVDVGYTIQFENDPEIATAAAHKIVVKDTLDGNLFDLSTFAATGVLLGDKRIELNGEKSFVRTIDMRTSINVIAEVSLDYDETQGIATWTIRSLDPMTMEETLDYMQGVLPVNNDGNGQGELYFDIKLREGLADGTKIPNRASIVFDFEEAIITPTWINTIDNTLPSSEIVGIEELNDTILRISWNGSDSDSQIYKYALYVQEGEDGEWNRVMNDTAGVYCDYRYYRDIDYGFCVLATDSAGNVESTEWTRKAEFMRTYIAGNADKNGSVNLLDLNLTLSHILGNEVSGCDMLQMDANDDGSINVLDINAILQIILDADGEAATLRKRDNGVIRIINTKVL